MILSLALSAFASSHREAPAISLDPAADLTDFYMFKSPEDPTKLVLIMNVNPLEEPGGGPNFHKFDDNVLYEIHIDNEGDAEADVTYQFQFATSYQQPDTFLYNTGSVATSTNLNMVQTYSVTMVKDGAASTILTKGTTGPINVGVASVPSGAYNPTGTTAGSLTTAAISTSSGRRFFAGPRQEGFYVDLEHTFDLLNLGSAVGNNNSLLGKNVHSIAIEVPLTEVTLDGAAPSTSAKNNVIAAWATTSRRAVSVRRSDGESSAARGNWVQVARLGNPLVNEVVLPIKEKDIFNASNPRDDGQFLAYVNHSLLADYMNAILGTSCPATAEQGLPDASGFDGRDDLVLAFLTGYPGINQWPGFALGGDIPAESSGKTYAAYEALRMDLTGASGWPNGRAVGDDVVDTALSAVCGLLVDGTTIPDGVDSTGLSYLKTFPFLGDPWSGNDHPHGGHDR
jgi:hypothetical protein